MTQGEDNGPGERPKVGVSTCLLGEPVRYDGGHKRDRYITDTLGQYFDWVPVCPEVECGLPVPRESMHLEGDPAAPRLVTTRTHLDHTERMHRWAERRLRELACENLCGYIFKSNSPSSGMERIRVYDAGGVPRKVGVGLFAAAFMVRFPLLPVEDEGRLHDAHLRENFIERIFCLKRYRDFRASDASLGGLVAFHSRHKLQLMSHSPKLLGEMGRLVADAKQMPMAELLSQYERLLMDTLAARATRGRNANVLEHMLGYFKEDLSPDEKQEMVQIVAQYQEGLLPLIVPVILVQHYVHKYRPAYLLNQSYLAPHPIELQLRNHG